MENITRKKGQSKKSTEPTHQQIMSSWSSRYLLSQKNKKNLRNTNKPGKK